MQAVLGVCALVLKGQLLSSSCLLSGGDISSISTSWSNSTIFFTLQLPLGSHTVLQEVVGSLFVLIYFMATACCASDILTAADMGGRCSMKWTETDIEE